MMAQNIDIGKEKLYISTNQDARRACRFTPLSSRQKFETNNWKEKKGY